METLSKTRWFKVVWNQRMRFVVLFPNIFLRIEVLMTQSLRAYCERRKAWGFVRLAVYVPKGEIELVETILLDTNVLSVSGIGSSKCATSTAKLWF